MKSIQGFCDKHGEYLNAIDFMMARGWKND
jgi:hypothetical protein